MSELVRKEGADHPSDVTDGQTKQRRTCRGEDATVEFHTTSDKEKRRAAQERGKKLKR